MKRDLLIILFIVLWAGGLISCTGAPERNLASEAAMVHKDVSSKAEIRWLLGPPDRIVQQPKGRQIWLYYQVQRSRLKSLLKKLPWLDRHLPGEKIEVLRITFQGNKVVNCTYYIAGEDNGT